MERYICIHGHFYQPPRENPWLEAIEIQDSAYPYHDWNERVTAECYEPNATSRILDGDERIVQIVNNYARISFNIGPTLLAWMERHAPGTYAAILAADRESQARFGGHGSALAQGYNHIIMPLANRRDKTTQVAWGLRDFEQRFGRPAQGMWLAETAVDTETLEVLAEQGVRFTILAPSQAAKVRLIGDSSWSDVGNARIDPTRAYVARLPSGRSMTLFFYDGPIARAVAFEGLLSSGETFAARLGTGFEDSRAWPQLVHIATDGETYGHHHKQGDMALAYTLDYIERTRLARLTNYSQYLAKYPPTHEVQILENSSWSCVHGVERWRSDCGCNSGRAGWNQAWRGPLREALDWLRDAVAPCFEELGATLLNDPWAARNDYIELLLDRSAERVDAFFARHGVGVLTPEQRTTTLRLLECQRHALLMYTSCGWFFDEISGLETVQVLMYAGRAIQLAEQLFGQPFETPFLELLAKAPSNLREYGDGRGVYGQLVQPARVDAERLAAHYAVSSLFEHYERQTTLYCYTVESLDEQRFENEGTRLVVGRACFVATLTGEEHELAYAVAHLGGHSFYGGVAPLDAPEYAAVLAELSAAMSRAEPEALLASIEERFGESTYALSSLFRDEQRAVIDEILAASTDESEQILRQVYERQAPLMRFLHDMHTPLPRPFTTAAEVVLTADLRRALQEGAADSEQFRQLLADAAFWGLTVDAPGLAYTLGQTIERQISLVRSQIAAGIAPAATLPLLQQLLSLGTMAKALPSAIDVRQAQNIYYEMAQGIYPEMLVAAERSAAGAQEWADRFAEVGAALGVRIEPASKVWQLKTTDAVAVAGQELLARRNTPRATYRLQFNESFTLADALALVPYLHELGISDLYASPLLQARKGSTHGYDTCDYSRINTALGGQQALDALAEALQARGMGLILDVVPNHMGIGPENAWWMDLLENGPSSIFAAYFDVDWQPVKLELHDKVLLPILGDLYGSVLEAGAIQLAYGGGAFFLDYFETRLPLAPRSYAEVLGHALDALVAALDSEHEQVRELQSIITAVSYLPSRTETDQVRVAERHREKEVIKSRIARLYEESPELQVAIGATLKAFNGTPGVAHTFDQLDQLIDRQAYRLSFWRVAGEEINYRRFFDINELAAIRMEDPAVFAAAHELILRLLAEGKLSGLRIDHSDGLLDPAAYFRQLQENYLLARLRAQPQELAAGGVIANGHSDDELQAIVASWLGAATTAAEGTAPGWPLYIVAEKILAEGEPLPENWAIAGTTGYDWLNACNGIFINRQSHKAIYDAYSGFIEQRVNFRNLVNSSKKLIMLVSLAGELNALSHALERISEKNRAYRDFTLNSLTFALREVIACLPIYRTYVDAAIDLSERDQQYVETAVAEARRRNPRTAGAIFDFIRDTMLLRNIGSFPDDQRPSVLGWVRKLQQISGPVMAKGVEDTSFYIYNPLTSLNEVGGHPERFGATLDEFHAHNAERARRWPTTMLCLSTHDTKRSEDVRARISVLSELPERWVAALARWRELNAAKKQSRSGGEAAPDANDEYLFYQSLLGAWPFATTGDDRQPVQREEVRGERGGITQQATTEHSDEQQAFAERMVAYMQKATKEAKVHTSWVNANPAYDGAMESFVRAVLADEAFIADMLPLAQTLACFGQWNALAQTVLKLTSPGVPDTYQGTELWDLSLVDPDNRRPVDYERRAALLAALRSEESLLGDGPGALLPLAGALLEQSADGRIKLYVTAQTLGLRAGHEELFASGSYTPLIAEGDKAAHLVAFGRTSGESAILVAVPRLMVGLTEGAEHAPLGSVWAGTVLPLPEELRGSYRNLFTGEVLDGAGGALPAAAVFAAFPVALLVRL